VVSPGNIRCANEFKALLAEVKLDFIKNGKSVPSNKELTKIIAKKMTKEDILYDKFIKL